jgi:hypothetical protein
MTETSTTRRKGAKTQRNSGSENQMNLFSGLALRLGAFATGFSFC